MDYEKNLQITVNLNPNVGKGQSRSATTQLIDKTMFEMKNLIIENVAFYVTTKQQNALKQNIHRTFQTIVDKELARMGRQINTLIIGLGAGASRSRAIGSGGAAGGPSGTLSISGAESLSMRGQVGPASLAAGTGPWPARNAKYIAWKKKNLGHAKWFQNTRQLGEALANINTYYNSYGPVRVNFFPATKATVIADVIGISSQGAGVAGRRTPKIGVGRIEVGVLGRISADQLGSPGHREPSAWHTGLFASLPSDVERKLLNREDFYRPFLETFLDYYLTRSVPNAVFRQIEKVTANALASEVTLK